MKLKRLNLQEMTKVYQLLKPAMEGRELEEVIIDEIEKIIELSSPEALLECLHIIYDNKVELNSPAEFLELLVNGLIDNEFFEFLDFTRMLNNGSTR